MYPQNNKVVEIDYIQQCVNQDKYYILWVSVVYRNVTFIKVSFARKGISTTFLLPSDENLCSTLLSNECILRHII